MKKFITLTINDEAETEIALNPLHIMFIRRENSGCKIYYPFKNPDTGQGPFVQHVKESYEHVKKLLTKE